MENFKNLMDNLKVWQKICLALVPILIIATIVVAIVANLSAGPKLKITFEEGVSVRIPGSELLKVRRKLLSVVESNTSDFDTNIVYEGYARDYEEETSGDTTTADFIVDFDTIRQSYSVMVTWPDPGDGSPNIYISCPLEESKYPETECKTEVNGSASEAPYGGKVLVFYNQGELLRAFNREFMGLVVDDITAVVFSSDEMRYSRENASLEEDNKVYYDATIENFAVSNIFTSKFETRISDQRLYRVITRTDSLYDDFGYLYTAIMRQGGDKIFLYAHGDEEMLDTFTSYVEQELGINNVQVVKKEL